MTLARGLSHTLADREVWLAAFPDSEGNPLALMSEPRLHQARLA